MDYRTLLICAYIYIAVIFHLIAVKLLCRFLLAGIQGKPISVPIIL